MLLHSVETFYGFIKDVEDAHLLVEACIGGLFEPVRDISVSGSSLAIRSGSVVVLQESVSSTSSTSMRMRWPLSVTARWTAVVVVETLWLLPPVPMPLPSSHFSIVTIGKLKGREAVLDLKQKKAHYFRDSVSGLAPS
ncbi:hypothetical protein BC830DRAFT_1076295 [Chytriomyces sp. MP71]|nr:hypothetical protein BC830DRAFT_1076295 [Chytriomyces sp. MP71]